ncbi:MAG: hypothetical protein UT02_C0017G0024 [Parcubacteria group bacterium GW2011_GWC2_38_7]|nr:MAG: hypothetical protein UT02_C0017G0024 [Parcubacteria group bacterium GW2011_GWC2_38_7]
MPKPDKIIDVNTNESLEQIEEDIIEAVNKAGKRNVIVNIFAAPKEKLKRRWQVRYKFNKKHLVVDSIIALGVLFLIGLNVFWAYGGFHYFFNRLDFTAQFSNEKVVSGLPSEIVVEYNNRNKFEIEEAVLSLTFPKYFKLESVDRENYDALNNILVLGDLAPGANGRIVVKGTIYGNIDEQQAVFGAINYFKTNKKGDRLWGQFRKNMILEYSIYESPIKLSAQIVSNEIVRGQTIYLPITVTNTSDSITYKKLVLTSDIDSEVKATEELQAEVTDLKPGESKEISFKINIDTVNPAKEIKFKLNWVDSQWDLVQALWSQKFEVVDQKFSFSQKILNAKSVNPGDWVDIQLDYENAGTFTLENVTFGIMFIGDYWDLSNIKKADGNFYPASQTTLTWAEKELPKLALIQPGEKGSINISVKTKAYVSGSSDFSLTTRTFNHNVFKWRDVQIESEPLITKLNTNLAVQVYPMYYAPTGDQLGRGPLPPKVNEQTKYWVFAKLINDISAVENVTLSMELPFNVSWSDRSNVPVGNPLVYDPNTRTISWTVSKLPVKPTNIGFAFEVGIIPSASQIGQNPVLIQNIKISGRDERTGSLIEKDLGNITTKLIQDIKGKLRDGVVR